MQRLPIWPRVLLIVALGVFACGTPGALPAGVVLQPQTEQVRSQSGDERAEPPATPTTLTGSESGSPEDPTPAAVSPTEPPTAAVVLASPTLAPTSTPTPAPPPVWAITFDAAGTPAFAAPGDEQPAQVLRQFTYVQILGYVDEWIEVLEPRTQAHLWVASGRLGEADAPPAWVTAPPPPALEELRVPARVVGSVPLMVYPVDDPWAAVDRPGHNAPVTLVERVLGDDGGSWYRTDDGAYVRADQVRVPRPPARTFAGRWIDADLSSPALLTAYQGTVPVMTSLVIVGVGRWPTPLGVFAINRRVANETMDSATIGIARNGPGGYYLRNVLYTQYFSGGASIHYNYWSGVWGYAGSHGCLGLPYDESLFLWGWASYGTPVFVHY